MFPEGDTLTASEKTRGNFIELNSGEIKTTKKLDYKTPMIGKAQFVLDNGERFDALDVVAYQLDRVYHRKYGDKYHYASRIIKGNINVYVEYFMSSDKSPGGGRYQDPLYYIQKGDKMPLVVLRASNLKDMVSDYEPSYGLVKKLPGYTNKGKKIMQAIELYNSRKV
jgi:hypothetical protein